VEHVVEQVSGGRRFIDDLPDEPELATLATTPPKTA
jgi:hypothetical protein